MNKSTWSESNWDGFIFCDLCYKLVKFLLENRFKFKQNDVAETEFVCPGCGNNIVCEDNYLERTLIEMKKTYDRPQE